MPFSQGIHKDNRVFNFLVRENSLVVKHTLCYLATKHINKDNGGSTPHVINSQKSYYLNPNLQSFTLEDKGDFLFFTVFGKSVF